ncbi:hypothetical protein RM533_08770 [Croceicoccus sp. F390]|uniref:Uncharacterized protein n=1 Tax=Croceicoccus esteveae TaxID=3075597 RepID=A0ABU2ZI43_9SPHN|nr:hypothetical protein [Croceicoccus sp. F390]MDT0576278.1 hypothetical protein [Croceicoccus sp. F390]
MMHVPIRKIVPAGSGAGITGIGKIVDSKHPSLPAMKQVKAQKAFETFPATGWVTGGEDNYRGEGE